MATLIPNFDLAQKIGDRLDIEASSVGELIKVGVQRYGEPFKEASSKAAIVVNGRAVQHLKGKKTPLVPEDVVWFVLPSAGG